MERLAKTAGVFSNPGNADVDLPYYRPLARVIERQDVRERVMIEILDVELGQVAIGNKDVGKRFNFPLLESRNLT